MSAERTFARLGHAVESFSSKFCAEMEGCGASRECDGVLAADLLGGNPFDLVDVRADGAHPVGFVSFGDVLDFVAVHRRATEPNFFFKTRHTFCILIVLLNSSGVVNVGTMRCKASIATASLFSNAALFSFQRSFTKEFPIVICLPM